MKLHEIKLLREGYPSSADISAYLTLDNPTIDEFMDALQIFPENWSYIQSFSHSKRINVTGEINIPEAFLLKETQTSAVFPYALGIIDGNFRVYSSSSTHVFLKEFCGPVDVKGSLIIDSYGGKDLTNGPRTVEGDYVLNDAPNLTSFNGVPTVIGGSFDIYYADKLSSLDHVPREIGGNFTVQSEKIISLVGISDKIHKINGLVSFWWSSIKEGGLGLLNIEGVTELAENLTDLFGPWEIIDHHLRNGKDIFQCQTELIDAGYEEFAKL